MGGGNSRVGQDGGATAEPAGEQLTAGAAGDVAQTSSGSPAAAQAPVAELGAAEQPPQVVPPVEDAAVPENGVFRSRGLW